MPEQESPQIKFKIITLEDDLKQKQPKEVNVKITGQKLEKPEAKKISLTKTLVTKEFQVSPSSSSAIKGYIKPRPTEYEKTKPETHPTTHPKQAESSLLKQPEVKRLESVGIPPTPKTASSSFLKTKRSQPIATKQILITIAVLLIFGIAIRIYQLSKQAGLFQPKPVSELKSETTITPIFIPPTTALPINLSTSTPVTSTPVASTPKTLSLTLPTSTIATTSNTKTITTPTTTTTTQPIQIVTSTIPTPPIPQPPQLSQEPPSPKITEPVQGSHKEIVSQGRDKTESLFALIDIPTIEITISGLTEVDIKQGWLTALNFQRSTGTLTKIDFTYQNQPLPSSVLINYFIRPNPTETNLNESLKQSFAPNATLLFYYSYTRKFPSLVIDLNNDLEAVTWLKLWDKKTMLRDLKPLYTDLPFGKFIRNYFVSRSLDGIDYRIAFTDKDYKLIWTVYNRKLIISTSLLGFKAILKQLQQ
jgi:hypothetical protein